MNFTGASKVLVQGITEPAGLVYAPLMQTYGTQIVAGVSPGHGGETHEGIPIFDLVEQAQTEVGPIDITVIFVHPYQAMDAALEAIAAGIRQIVLISEGVPPLDMIRLIRKAEATETLVVGPNSPGLIVPEQLLLGTLAAPFYTPGAVGILSRSGTLTDEVALALTHAGLGQSIAVGIGGDRIVGSSFQQWLQILEEDEQTDVIVLIGEIGGDSEEAAAHYIMEAIDKPVIAYIAGRTAPTGQLMGHAGAIIASQISDLGTTTGTAESKIEAFRQAKVAIADTPARIPELVRKALKPTAPTKV
ncbi:MAG TPA: CoA-binding protein [Crinalium sp.]|jgi:succinyl-CoA synthetase alpha subunit